MVVTAEQKTEVLWGSTALKYFLVYCNAIIRCGISLRLLFLSFSWKEKFEGLSAVGLVGDDSGSRGLVMADHPGLVDDKPAAVTEGCEPVDSADSG